MAALFLAAAVALSAGPASAQADPAGSPDPGSPPSLALVIRPEPRLSDLARRVAAMVSRRTGEEVVVGDPPPPEVPEAVPRGHVALVSEEGALLVVLGGRYGTTYAAELNLRQIRGSAAVRSVALAVETLRDTALASELSGRDVPPSPRTADERVRTRWVFTERAIRQEGEPWRPFTALPPAKPTIYLRTLLGYSPVQRNVLVGPGAGLGLCLGGQCVVLEADLPLVPEERTTPDAVTVRYRAVNTSMRFQWRPWTFGDWTPGLTFGLLTRIGAATIPGTDARRVVTNLGWRTTLELAWAFAERFEIAIETGVDLAISRARFIRRGSSVFLEDRWTPWLVTSFRLRPGARGHRP